MAKTAQEAAAEPEMPRAPLKREAGEPRNGKIKRAPPAAAAAAGAEARSPGRGQGGILLVDDNEGNLIALEAILRDLGQELVRAHSGQECLRLLFDRDFAVILLDVRMPDMDGYETAELIRKRQRSRHTPIIFITAADARAGEITRGYGVGAVDYIFKPFMPEVLKAKARIFLELYQKNAEVRANEARLRTLIANLPGAVYRRTAESGETLFVSDSIESLCGHAPAEFLQGQRGMLELLEPEDAAKAAEELRQARQPGPYALEYRIRHRDGRIRWVLDRGHIIRDESGAYLEGVLLDITDRKIAEASLSDLLGRLLQTQDEERRKIARELHDTTSPPLTGLISKLYSLRHRGEADPATMRSLDESLRLAEDTANIIRNIAYMLHPRLLDENGLLPSLRWYVNRFTQQTGIGVAMHLPEELPRYGQEVETALFRVVQECLTNIARHAGSKAAEIQLIAGKRELLLTVGDRGHGMAGESQRSREGTTGLKGIGIAGMRERLRQIGGRLEIASGDSGTRITALLPLAAEQS